MLKTRHPDPILNSIDKSKLLATDGDASAVVVRWGLDEAQKLTELTYKNVPSPILRDYKWPTKWKPFAHQKETASFLTLNKRAFCFSDQGTGKTAAIIWAADYLLNIGAIRRVLIVCPLSIMKPAWQADMFKFAMHRSCSIAHGSSDRRRKIINAGSDFVVINFDGVGVVHDAIAQGGFDLIVIDECSSYKHASTARWKVMNKLASNIEWLWMMTGTPAAQSPLDAYGIAKLLNPAKVPKFYGHFRDKVMYKISKFRWLVKPGAKEYVHTVLQPAIRFERSQCLDLPEVTHMHREAPMTKQQLRMYNTLKKELLLEENGAEVSAVNAAVKINKLLQIACGSVYTDDGNILDIDVKVRLNVVLEIIEEAANKVLVFVPFTHSIELLNEFLTKNGVVCEIINGKVPVNRRNHIISEFQTKENPRVLIIQPQAASHGLTLTKADTIVWYAPITSVETYLQANARINRPGQKNAMSIIHIQGSAIETKIYNMLETNILNHSKIIDLYKREITTS